MWRKGNPESVSQGKGAGHGLKYPFKGADRERDLDLEDRRDCLAGRDEGVWEDPSSRRLCKERAGSGKIQSLGPPSWRCPAPHLLT